MCDGKAVPTLQISDEGEEENARLEINLGIIKKKTDYIVESVLRDMPTHVLCRISWKRGRDSEPGYY